MKTISSFTKLFIILLLFANCSATNQQIPPRLISQETMLVQTTPSPQQANTQPVVVASNRPITPIESLKEAITRSITPTFRNVEREQRIAIVNISSPNETLSNIILGEIEHALVSTNYRVVDRSELDRIRIEQAFQLDWEVDDNTAVNIGKFVGAEIIVTGSVNILDSVSLLRLRVLDTQTAIVIGSASETYTTILGLPANQTRQTVVTSPATPQTPQQTATVTQIAPTPTMPAEPPIEGIMVPGSDLFEKLAWLRRSADSNNTYIIEISKDETIAPHIFQFENAVNISVVLKGDSVNRTIKLSSNGSMFTVRMNVTLILDNNITLHGHRRNTEPLIDVQRRGALKMRNGATITGNENITTSRYAGTHGGAVRILMDGNLEMQGGTIKNNFAHRGGGVNMEAAHFVMSGGSITGNSATLGGGIYANNVGGIGGSFIMRGGSITNNTAHEYGGGVYIMYGTRFSKTGGIISGYSNDPDNGNAVRDDSGIIARRGHAIYLDHAVSGWQQRKNTTSGVRDNMGAEGTNVTGAWDN